MPKKYDVDDQDLQAFRAAVKGTKPLKTNKIRLKPPQREVTPQYTNKKDDEIVLYDKNDLNKVRGEEFISYKQESISHKTLRKLRKGQYNVDAILDLHGMTVDRARNAVQ